MSKFTALELEKAEKERMREYFITKRDTLQKRVKKLSLHFALGSAGFLLLAFGLVVSVATENSGVYVFLFFTMMVSGIWAKVSFDNRQDALNELRDIDVSLKF